MKFDTPEDMRELIQSLSVDFDDLCNERHLMGAEKYGPLKFFTADTLEEMMQEILDIANYARYTYIKLRLMQMVMAKLAEEVEEVGEVAEGMENRPTLGVDGWNATNKKES